jgi:hypothetical protein
MKQQVTPVVAVIAVVVVLGIAVFAWMRSGGVENRVGEKPPGMPPEAAAKWNEITGGRGAGAGGSSIPSGPGGAPGGMPTGPGGTSIPTGPGGVPTGPPAGR